MTVTVTDENQKQALITCGFSADQVDEVLARVNWRKERIAAGDTELEDLVARVKTASGQIEGLVQSILTMDGDEALAARNALQQSEQFLHYQQCWQALDLYELQHRQAPQ